MATLSAIHLLHSSIMYDSLYPSYAVDYAYSSPSSSASQHSVSPSPFDYPPTFLQTQPINHQYQQLHHTIVQQPVQHQPHHIEFQQPYHTTQQSYPNCLQDSLPVQPLPKTRPPKTVSQARQVQISHPYARLFAKKDQVKRRKIWNHALEKSLFNPFEL